MMNGCQRKSSKHGCKWKNTPKTVSRSDVQMLYAPLEYFNIRLEKQWQTQITMQSGKNLWSLAEMSKAHRQNQDITNRPGFLSFLVLFVTHNTEPILVVSASLEHREVLTLQASTVIRMVAISNDRQTITILSVYPVTVHFLSSM